MNPYHKIQTLFKRDPKTNFKTLLIGEYAKEEFEYLKDVDWSWTEKVDGKVRISVTDDGSGISKRNQAKVFDPFFTTKEVGKGTGLGLSICYGIVQEHGGRLWVESVVGKGSTFTVELPITS